MKGYVYYLQNVETLDIFYIGSSFSPKDRALAHRSGARNASTPMHRYTNENSIEFSLNIIDEIETDNKGELLKWEIFWIHQFKAWGFNIKNSVLYRHARKKDYDPNKNPTPLRLGETKAPLQEEAFRLNISLHSLIVKILRDYVIERRLDTPIKSAT